MGFCEDEGIGPIEVGYRGCPAETAPEEVHGDIAMLVEASLPVDRPAFVDVSLTALTGVGGAEGHDRCVSGEALDQLWCSAVLEVLADFEAEGQVEVSPEIEG